jgi:hypothetical protein
VGADRLIGMSTRDRTYTLAHAGRCLVVETGTDGAANTARLLVEGEVVDEQRKWRMDTVELTADDVKVAVAWWWTGRPMRCDLLEPADDGGRPHKIPFEPPSGTRAHRLWQLQQDRPGLYAARHVAIAVGQVAATVLGLGVLLRSLLPRIDWSWVPEIPTGWVPEVDLPDFPDPLGWLWSQLPDVSLPGWVSTVAESWKWWGPILIAVLVASREYEKRKRPPADEAGRTDGPPGPVR